MKRFIVYSLLISLLLSACEEVYFPNIDEVESVIVAEARIEMGSNDNRIVLTQTQGFNDDSNQYAQVNGGKVTLIDDTGSEFKLPEIESGEFLVNVNIQKERQYQVRIEYDGNIFESEFEKVPGVPELDTVYGIPTTKILSEGGLSSSDDFREVEGVQLYADMKSTDTTSNYRFTGERVLETYWPEESLFAPKDHFYWKKTVVADNFNIAAPPEYSNTKNIIKHPLYFVNKGTYLEEDHLLVGWILVVYQHSISESAYNYYNDLNAQLHADGRIFDPIYVQARNNFTCVNNKDELILGNFEISQKSETRYFVRYISDEAGYKIRELSDRSPIPWSGETLNITPPFWANN